MQGERIADNMMPKLPGQYSYFRYSNFEHLASFQTGDGEWICISPNGQICALRENHAIEIHDDETISVSPSIVFPAGWHGFLRQGVWSG